MTRDAAGDVPMEEGAVKEGGETPLERRCTFMELALALAPGLDLPAMAVLYKAATPALQARFPGFLVVDMV